jgi:hypothetical protein
VSAQGRLQSSAPDARQADGHGQVVSQPRQFGPWLDTLAAADYLSYTGKAPRRSVYKFIQRHGIVVRHDGDRLLLARADVDRALELSHAAKCGSTHTSTVRGISRQLDGAHNR